jgi:murein L,D-transpeptidase YcbB/YkuD
VRRFQHNNGLRATGRSDTSTLQALNVPAQARLAQLRVNLQRLRELTEQRIEDRYVLVNVAAFQLEAVEHHQVELRHRVIAGKPERQTPAVRATIKAINFYPYWRVPESVAHLDLIPAARQGAGIPRQGADPRPHRHLQRPRGRSRPNRLATGGCAKLRFRQDPGPQNALGLLRLDMPNEHGVYMHDTPMKPLFNQRSRAFSAGCVRVQDVFALAEWVARNEQGWEQPGRVQEILARARPSI